MSMLFNTIPDGGALWGKPAKKKKKSAPRKGSVGANLKKINANVRRAANSAKRAGNVKGSVGASAGARMGSKAKPKAQARARVSTYSPTPIRRKAAPVKRKAAPVQRKKATYSNPGRVTGNTARRSSGGTSSSTSNYSGGGSAGISTLSAASAAPAYVEPPAPKPPTEKEWLAGDSAYNDQLSEYDRALQEYLARISAKELEVDQDARIALQSNSRNQSMGLNNNAEDFAARGMINSGLFANSAEQLNDRYGESRSAIETNKGRQLGSLTDERDTYRRENELGRGNARRQALQRMAMQFGGL